ncbi:amino acid adenylation domain-containing protein, partial [Exilibacterium tricleocarpae]
MAYHQNKNVSTVLDSFDYLTKSIPKDNAYTFLNEQGKEEEISFAALYEEVNAVAKTLVELGNPGDRVLILLESSLEYVAAFWGCLYAGMLAVPLYAPKPNDKRDRFSSVVADCTPELAFVPSGMSEQALDILPAELRCIKYALGDFKDSPDVKLPVVSPEDVAYLQYSSGSTGKPKGVVVRHRNLLANVDALNTCARGTGDDVFVGWLPLFHDMGLISIAVWPLVIGAHSVFFSPIKFVRRPLFWLQTIGRFNGTISLAPNFAYELCVSKAQDADRISALDLAGWRFALNGAEPIQEKTLSSFAQVFAAAGFKPNAFVAGYGMAEATLFVTAAYSEAGPKIIHVDNEALQNRIVKTTGSPGQGATAIVGCGCPSADYDVIIVDPDTSTRLGEDRVGEVWISGESIATGYWRRASLNEAVFQAFTDGRAGPYFRTGDLGFFHDQQLFLSGRLADLIIVNGRNVYPHDIELKSSSIVSEYGFGNAAAIGVDDRGTQGVVLIQEVRNKAGDFDHRALAERIQAEIFAAFDLLLKAVVMVPKGALVKTTSGKIRRRAIRERYLSGSLATIFTTDVTPEYDLTPNVELRTTLEKELAQIWALLLDREVTSSRANFIHLGGDSLLVNRMIAMVREKWSIDLDITRLFEEPVLSAVAQAIQQCLSVRTAENKSSEQEPIDTIALSQQQQGLWLSDQIEGGRAKNNIFFAFQLEGELDLRAFEKTCRKMVDRHPSLRTRFFVAADAEPQQQVYVNAELSVPLIELDEPDEASTQKCLQALLREESVATFDLSADCMLRAKLLKLSAARYAALFTLHHIASDGWSVGLFLKEFGEIYQGLVTGRDASLPVLTAQYKDYVIQQRGEKMSDRTGADIDYWRRQLSSAPEVHSLPLDFKRKEAQSYSGAEYRTAFDARITEQLKALSRQQNATLFMGLHAAFVAFLAYYSGEEDVVVGTSSANRHDADFYDVIGCFVNVLALRANIDDNDSFTQLLTQSKRLCLEAFHHQSVSLDRLITDLNPHRSSSYQPLVQILLVLQNNQPASLTLPGLSCRLLEAPTQYSQFDLTLEVSEQSGELALSWKFNREIFSSVSIQRLAARFERLVRQMVAQPERGVFSLSLLSGAERDSIEAHVGDIHSRPVATALMHQRFEAAVEADPLAIALTYGEANLSYGELNRRANQLAHYLLAQGVRPDTLVGLCMMPAPELVIGILGILKAGGAYVPLDPNNPRERLQYQLDDAQPALIITQRAVLAAAPVPPAQSLCLDDSDVEATLVGYSDENPDPATLGLDAGHLMYVIYTSGSTGQPKGVLVEHGHASRLFGATEDSFGFNSRDVWTLFHSVAFDFSVWELWGALSYGGRLVIVDKLLTRSPEAFYGLLEREGVTVLNQTPSAFNQFVGVDRSAGESGLRLRYIIFGGEALNPALLQPWVAAHGDVEPQLINMYGITETTVHVTYRRLYQADTVAADSVIGHPLPDLSVLLLSAGRQPVPAGVVGEIYVGGAGLSRGYLNQPGLTASRFIEHPFIEGQRLYRSGDLGRYNEAGELVYLGRNDQQIKLRGFRIELGDIETRLLAYPAIDAAAVLLERRVEKPDRLLAYVTATEGATLDVPNLHAYLGAHLPTYMLPAAVVVLECLPLTANGKLDRKALLQADIEPLPLTNYAVPVGPIEQTLAAIWAELLDREQIGRNDNFFALGGHSLLAVRLVTMVRHRLGRELNVREVFDQPVLRSLAYRLGGSHFVLRERIDVADRGEPLPLSWAQQRLWFLAKLEGANAAYHIPVALRLSGSLAVAALTGTLNTIVSRHEALRTVFREEQGEPRQVILPADHFAFVQKDISDLDAEARRRALAEEIETAATAAFDLTEGPLFRGRLLRLAATDHVLLLTLHHIVADGWSMRVLVDEINALYRSHIANESNPLPPPALQYGDYAAWQRGWLTGKALQRQEAYWQSHLHDAPALLELPTDRRRPAVQSYRGDSIAVVLPPNLSGQVKALARAQGLTVHMVLYAAWATLLSRLSGQDQIVVGTPVANRPTRELEELIGFFVNTLPLRVDLGGDPSVGELLARVKALTLSAYTHQDVPFERIVEITQPLRSMGHSPVFQVLFNLDNESACALELPGLQTAAMEVSTLISKYDLSLLLEEKAHGIAGRLEYATDLFDRQTVAGWAGNFTCLLENLCADLEASVRQLDLLPATERHRLVYEFNRTAVAYPQDSLIHQLFETQVAATPTATALVYQDQTLSYGELNARANRLAHYLITQGVTPDTLVGLCVERGLDMLVGVLGILKAGGAYVPLDPGYPDARLRYQIDDAGLALVLTQGELAARLPAATALCLDDPQLQQTLAAYPVDNPPPSATDLTASHLAYVIYTSGTTGQPKGSLLTHRGLVNLSLAQQRELRVEPDSRVLQFASAAFDASVWEWSMSLCHGARLVIPSAAVQKDPQQLTELVVAAGVTHATLPPSLLAHLERANWQSVQVLVVAGESCPLALARQWREGRMFVNGYGPSEATVCSSMMTFTESSECLTIGKPLQNVQYYVVESVVETTDETTDENAGKSVVENLAESITDAAREGADEKRLRLVPQGVPGELLIGGAGLARGYLNRPELTAAKFIRNPFDAGGSERLYRTGDRVRWTAQGELEFLGRVDQQVSLRGFRIELGEIETHLAAHPNVAATVVVLDTGDGGEQQLIAYLTPAAEPNPAPGVLRDYLHSRLPAYMIPAAFVVLASLPLTASGKVDRRGLPAPDAASFLHRRYEAPVGEIEEGLAEVWRELLSVERVGREDSFFELGGHSLLVVQLIARLQAKGLQADVRAVFTAPKLRELARAIKKQLHGNFKAPANRIPADCTALTPDLLPLVSLEQAQIDEIVARIPGGAENIEDIYPLAPLQEGVLFHHMLSEPAAGDTYILPILLAANDPALLRQLPDALRAVIARHDVLRTAVLWEGLPQAVQVVQRSAELAVTAIELDPDIDPRTQLQQRIAPEKLWMALSQAPLLQLETAADPQSDQYFAIIYLHHIVNDHVGLEVLIEELGLFLEADALALPAPIPYREFVAHTLALAQSADTAAYFRARLGDVEEPTLPFGLADIQVQAAQISEARLAVEPALAAAIRARSQRLGVNAASVFHLAWALVVGRCSDRDDVVFGTVLSGRLQGTRGAERMLGLFINTLPLRLSLRGSVSDCLESTYRELVGLLDYEQASLNAAQACSALVGDTPLFSALINYRYSGITETDNRLNASGIEVLVAQERGNYPFDLSVDDFGAAGFRLVVQVEAALDPQRIAAYMHCALEGIVDALERAPQRSLAELDILPPAERECLLHTFNRNGGAAIAPALIHQVFEAQVLRDPEARAVEHGDAHLSYGALNARANQLARYLREGGVVPGDRVGLLLPRSLDFAIAMLGVLKAGGVYVVLDPEHPGARLQQIGERAQLHTLISGRSLAPAWWAGNLLCVDAAEVRSALARQSVDNPDVTLDARAPAFAFFTSGSTGTPKGALNSHAGVVNNMQAMARELALTPADRVLQFASLGFDVVIEELYPAWFAGATVVLRDEEGLLDCEQLQALLRRTAVTVCELITGYWAQWLAYLCQRRLRPPATLRRLMVGGDRVALSLYQQWRAFGIPLINVFGLTEAGCTSLVYAAGCREPSALDREPSALDREPSALDREPSALDREPSALDREPSALGEEPSALGGEPSALTRELSAPEKKPSTASKSRSTPTEKTAAYLPCGRPLVNTQAYILDRRGEPVPLGVVGELYLGGAGVGLGYLDEPELSAAHFVPHPFDPTSGNVCRTGDLARWRADGELEFIGRRDCQVKVRGFRIELEEIEAQLLRDAAVGAAAVVLHEEQDRGNTATEPGHLIAWVSPADSAGLDTEQVRRNLAQRLPAYMLPAAIFELAVLPLTASGKVDRPALPAPDLRALAAAYEAPVGATETVLAEIWQALLGVEQVGRHDNFYQLGGHSLLAIRLVTSVQYRLGRALSLRDVFEYPVLKDLGHQLDAAHFITRQPLEVVARDEPLPLSRAQQRLWFIARLEGATAAYHVPGALRLNGSLSVTALNATLTTLVMRHEVLRTVFTEVHGEPRQVIGAAQDFVLTQLDLSHLRGKARRRAVRAQVQEESTAPFDLSQGPLFRGRLLRLSTREHVLLLTLHHIVADGWSMDILIREINTLYRAYCAGAVNPLPPLAIQYADYAVWQRRWLAGEVLERQETYWQNHLQEAPALLALPTDRPRPAQQSYRGDSVAVTLASDTVAQVKALAQAQGLTVHMVLLAAWVVVLSRLSGQERIVVGTPVANRQRHELEGLIGFFVNTLPLCADLSGNPTGVELLRRVKALSLAGYAHQDVPFERIVEVMQPARSMSYSPLFQVLFDLDHESQTTLSLPGLQLQAEAVETAAFSARFDLSLSLVDGAAGIGGVLRYATDLFDRKTIVRWADYFTRVVAALVSDVEIPVQLLSLLPDSERDQLLRNGRHPTAVKASVAPKVELLHALFEAQVRKHGAAPAVIYEEHTLSYRQLNRRANRLARYLMA